MKWIKGLPDGISFPVRNGYVTVAKNGQSGDEYPTWSDQCSRSHVSRGFVPNGEKMNSGIWERIKSGFHKESAKTRLTKDQVIGIATDFLTLKGDCRLRQPFNVGIDEEKGVIFWHIVDSVNTRGGNYHMQISDSTGEVVKTWATPR